MNNAIITIDGNLTRDPELRQVGATNVCNFTVAVNTDQKKEDGTYEANYYDCSSWGPAGDYIFSKIMKGTEVTVVGEFQAVDKPDVNGNLRTRLRVKSLYTKVRRGARDAAFRKSEKEKTETETAKPVVTEDDPTE